MPRSDEFSFWNWVCLRSAGFSAADIERLRSRNTAAAVDRLIDATATTERARARAIDACSAAIEKEAGNARKPFAKALKALRAGRLPDSAGLTGAETSLSELAAADQLRLRARDEAEIIFREQRVEQARFLRGMLDEPRFKEAVVWQNRNIWATGIELLRGDAPGATDSKTRQREQAVATYLQRYLLKNETIGFFGPIAWASIVPEGPPVTVRAGSKLLARRTVYFEYWAIDALAQALFDADPELRLDLPPRRVPTIRVERTTLHHPIAKTTELSDELASVLSACDGVTTARELAARFGEDCLETLEELAEQRLIFWTVELPTAGIRPEAALRSILLRVQDEARRARALEAIDRLEQRRQTIAHAEGAGELVPAIEALERDFTALTGAEATRLAGQAYAGRTLVYEECIRDVQVAFGPQFLERLDPPLSLLLESARWYTHEIATRYRRVLLSLWPDLSGGSATVDFQKFWERARPCFDGSIVAAVAGEVRSRWWELLAPAPGERRIARRASELDASIRALFSAPGPGWPAAKHHSPDLMIAAKSPEAIAAGDFALVLGELHAALNTVTNPFVALEHEDPAALIAARERDLPNPCIAPVWSKKRTRADFYSLSRFDFDFENGNTKSSRPREQVLSAGELVVENRGDSLWVRSNDGRVVFEIIAFLEQYLIGESHGKFSLRRGLAHSPRVTIDHLVVCREEWQFTPAELDFLAMEDPLDRLTAARAFAGRHGIPERVFVKIPEETKPFYLDFASPIFVDIFSRLARKSSNISISEMLPADDELWLPDSEGRKYTSELRIVAVDPRNFEPLSSSTL